MKNAFCAVIRTSIPLLFLLGCSDASADYEKALEEMRQPHEHIVVEGYGENWASTKGNRYRLMMSDTRKLKFKIGAGACEKHLKNIQKQDVSIHVAVANNFIRTEADGMNDIPIKHAKFQCVAMRGAYKNCEETKDLLLKQLLESGKFTPKLAAKILFVDCRIQEEVGVARTF